MSDVMEGTRRWDAEHGVVPGGKRRGKRGAQGPRGEPEGPHTHTMAVTVRTNTGSVASGAVTTVTAACLTGESVTGGGGTIATPLATTPLVGSAPSGTTGWSATFRNDSGVSKTITAYAVCRGDATSVGV